MSAVKIVGPLKNVFWISLCVPPSHTHPSKRCSEKAQPSGPQNEPLFGNRVGAGVVSEDEVMLSRHVDPTSDASRVLVKKWSCEDTEPRGRATW